MKNTINDLTELLELKAQKMRRDMLEEAQKQAKLIHRNSRMKAQSERNRILDSYKLKAKETRTRIDAEARAKSDHMFLAAKQEMIDTVIKAAADALNSRSIPESTKLLEKVFEKSVRRAGGEIPDIIVPENMVKAVKKQFDNRANVIKGDFKSGFILIFKSFNVNLETAALMSYWQESLEALAASYLFGGDENEES